MKTILIILMSITLSVGASAQRKGHYYAPRTHIYVVPFSYGIGYGYPYLGPPYFGFPYYGYGYPYPEYKRGMPYKLTKEIESIKSDYKYKIKAARKDKTLSRPQRRQQIRNLKSERDKEVINAEINFRRPGMNNKNYRKNQNDQKSGTNDPETKDQNQGNNNFSSVYNS